MKRRLWSKSLVRSAPLSVIGGAGGSVFLIFLALLSIFVSGFYTQQFNGMRAGVADAFAPVLSVVGKPVQEATLFIRNVTGLAELQAENARLQKENERLRDWYQSAMILEAENKSLRELLNIRLAPQDKYITARILADSGYAFVKSFLVEAGKRDGIKKGQAVVSAEGVIGRVIDVGEKTSRVLLVTDINSRVPILVENSRQHAVMAGGNDALPELIHLPPDSQVQPGDRIITSGHGGVFPYGLPVGRVVFDERKRPHVELFTDFDRLLYIRIIDRPEDPNLVSNQ